MNEPPTRIMPENWGGLEWKDITHIHPVGLLAVCVLGVATLLLPRRWATLPVFIMACFVPGTQKIAVLTLDFSLLRIMILFGWVRVWFMGGRRGFVWKPLDKAIILYVICGTIIQTVQVGTVSTLVYRLGTSFDALGIYFLFRCLVRDWEDVDRLILGCTVVSIPVAALFLAENTTGRNFFSFFGGIPEWTTAREGRLRCKGAMGNAILAGCFWAALMPLFASQWWRKKDGKLWAVVGVVTSLVIVMTCASSTPVLGVVAGLLGGLIFFFRYRMNVILWGTVCCLAALHVVMKAPVWNLIARVSAVGGSTGYFRYKLIDSAINRFGEWCLVGTRSTAHWFWGAQDVCNHYIYEGVRGGFLTLAVFVAVICLAFKSVGRLWRGCARDTSRLAVAWTLGVSLFVHCAQFIGVSYPAGAILISWYMPLAIVGSLSPATKVSRRVPVSDSRLQPSSHAIGP